MAVAGCSKRDLDTNGVANAGSLTGVVVNDVDGDGSVSSGDRYVIGAELRVATNRSDSTSDHWIDDQRFRPAQTDADGRFAIDLGGQSFNDGPQVVVTIPLSSGDQPEVGSYNLFLEVVPDEFNVVVVTLPQQCATVNIRENPSDCMTPAFPDLTPIISRDSFDGGSIEELDGQSSLLPTETWYLDDTSQPGKQLLRFGSLTANIGRGPLHVVGQAPSDEDAGQTLQRIWSVDRQRWMDLPAGRFIHHPTHNHVHFDAFERYTLTDAAGVQWAQSDKVSFCLYDAVRVVDIAQAGWGVSASAADLCGREQQSISPGFGDYYGPQLDDQWIDVTGVPPGEYIVTIDVDPHDHLIEEDETNNSVSFDVTL